MNSYVYYIFSIYISQKNIYAFVCCCLSWFYQTDRICILECICQREVWVLQGYTCAKLLQQTQQQQLQHQYK